MLRSLLLTSASTALLALTGAPALADDGGPSAEETRVGDVVVLG